ncbi:DUF6817 domain-containing protein [Actinoplanes sp. NPDC049316]|uniref:DUF6817 domain-containing protein n=1 Tax=Actinoplanes sp. NPDC049316 TaxID=3154727 RepID=UPI0034444489
MNPDDVRAWLRERGAETIDHPGGTLYAHLGRVHDRLGALGHGRDVCLAGLAHAAYGTDGFDLTLCDPADRGPLRALVGARAEALIHTYGGCDRSATWDAFGRTRRVVDRWSGQPVVLGDEDTTAFADLSIVNELDVCEQDPRIAERHGSYFRTVFASWRAVASPALVEELDRLA